MKRVKILSSALIPSDVEGQPRIAHRDSVIEVDDDVAGQLIASQRAVYATKEDKLKDTTKVHEEEADRKAELAKSPEAAMIALITAAVTAAMSSQAVKPAGG